MAHEGGQSLEQIRHLLGLCEQGHLAGVQNLLDQGLDVDCTDSDELTPLHVAAANGHVDLVRLLLMRGAALDKPNTHAWTPLICAARHGHHNVVALLLQSQADVNARTKLGASVLMLAARGGHLQTCKLLLEAGADISPSSCLVNNPCELTPLMAAAQYGHDSVVRYLLDSGYDVNFRAPSTGVNALMLAARNGHMTTCQILIERYADPDLTNVNDHTALEVATLQGKREVQGYLDRKTKNKPKINPEEVKPDIIEAAKRGDYMRMKEILDEDLTQRDACSPLDGATPLMFAAMMGRLDMIQLLVEKGCDINKQDKVSGWTALMQATYHGKKVIAKYLVGAGADVLVPAMNGCTAFDMACLIEDVDTELYRLLAAKAVTIKSDRRDKSWNGRQNGSATQGQDAGGEDHRTGLKAWWSRMSNRFRNLKLGRTFNLSSNRLAPLPIDAPSITDDELISTDAANNSSFTNQLSHSGPKKSVSVDGLDLDATYSPNLSSTMSYDTIMNETKKSASVYTLGLNAPMSIEDGTLKPVLPPFFPPPSFETDRPKMPPVSSRRPLGSMGSTATLTSTKPILRPMKFLQMYASSQTLNSTPATSSNKYDTNNSPSSSGGATSLGVPENSRGVSSASSSTLTAGSENLHRHGTGVKPHHASNDSVFNPLPIRPPLPYTVANAAFPIRPESRVSPSTFRKLSHTSPNSSTSDSSSLTPQKHPKSGSSKSTNSTLTPSPSPTPKPPEEPISSPSENPTKVQLKMEQAEDELGGLLKKLSLEKYQTIFEEQEVDMEAFLTMTDQDLKELGIQQRGPRKTILTAITELSTGKGRERQHFQETMTHYQSSTMTSQDTLSDTQDLNVGYSSSWSLQQGEPHVEITNDKSRAS